MILLNSCSEEKLANQNLLTVKESNAIDKLSKVSQVNKNANTAEIGKNIVTAETIQDLPSIKEYRKLADAIDKIDKKSKVPEETQIANYLDQKYFKNYTTDLQKFKSKIKIIKSVNTDSKLAVDDNPTGFNEVLDLDQQLNEVGFAYLQRQYVTEITSLYPLDDASTIEITDNQVVDNIKTGLINTRNRVAQDLRLTNSEQYQLFDYIDVQYATLYSVVDYVKTNMGSSQIPTARFSISFKKILNIVVSIIVTTAICLVTAAIGSLGNPDAAVIGGIFGFASGVTSAVKNSCIKFCGTGYCNTAWNDCYTSQFKTFFTLKSN